MDSFAAHSLMWWYCYYRRLQQRNLEARRHCKHLPEVKCWYPVELGFEASGLESGSRAGVLNHKIALPPNQQ